MFFLIDASKSMEGNKIGAVNDSMSNVIPIIRELSEKNPDADIQIAVLVFNTTVNWVTPGPQPASGFVWVDVRAEGLTSLGAACEELNEKLSRSSQGFMQSPTGYYPPAIILLSDGVPTDDIDAGLNKLMANNWFKVASKIAIAIGNDADTEVLKKFTGNIESVIGVHELESLKALIRMVSVTSAQIGSRSSSVGQKTKQEELISDLHQQAKNLPDVEFPEPGASEAGIDEFVDKF